MKLSICHAVAVLVFFAVPAAGQVMQPPDPATVRVRLGPLWINPSIALTNAGIDTNVFNDPEDLDPKRDFTLRLSPNADIWLRMGPTWIASTVGEDVVWYQKFASERSADGRYSIGWLVPLTRLTFSVDGRWLHTRERPGFEIDARPRRDERQFSGAVEVRALSRTRFGVRGGRRNVDFENATFLGVNLRDELTRTNTAMAVTIRHEVTPLTTLTVDLGEEQERFAFSTLRDSDSRRAEIGVAFDPFALITGTARFGFRDFKPLAGDLPGYRGATTNVDLTYTARGSTRLSVQAIRDIEYSFDRNQPYYLQVGVTGSLAQQIYGPLDVEGRAGIQRLSYRTRQGAAAGVPDNREDDVHLYGGGFGYRSGRDFRIGFNVDRQRRTSVVGGRGYDGLRYGISATYGR